MIEKNNWSEINNNISKIKDKIIPKVVKTATVEKIKKINLRIFSTLRLASNLIFRRLIAKKPRAPLNKDIIERNNVLYKKY